MSLTITVFDGVRDNRPVARRCTVPGLLRACSTFRIVGELPKREIPCWSAASYPEGATRSAANVREVSALVLDVDDGTPIDEILGCFPWRGAWHTSISHTPERPRYRAVFPFASAVSAELWPRVFAWAQARAGGHLDPSTKDASRLWLVAAIRHEDSPHASGLHRPGEALLDIAAVELPKPRGRTTPPPRPSLPVGAPAWRMRREAQDALKTDPGARLDAARALGARLGGAGPNQRAHGIECPACGRASMWFWIDPDASVAAYCGHRNSCGARRWLDELGAAMGS